MQIRVTPSGVKTFCVFRRIKRGQPERITLGRYPEMTIEHARRAAAEVNAVIEGGASPSGILRERKEKEGGGLTLSKALHDYVQKKRRGKDGLALKERTKADYLAMLEPGRKSKKGDGDKSEGALYHLARKSINKITANDVRALYAKLEKRGPRQATYAMQLLRATLNWHGIKVDGNPLSKDVAGRDRIVLPSTRGKPNPIPTERLGQWWRTALSIRDEASDYYRFLLLTGTRGGEIKGGEFSDGILIRDVDLAGARIILRDTKNRKDHTLLLSRQALEIAERQVAGKKPTDPLFSLGDPRKRLTAINEAAGVNVSPHDLRATFATIAEGLVSYATLKRLVNHIPIGDVTSEFYIGMGESQLRAGWQAVADFLDEHARIIPAPSPSNVVLIRKKK